MHIDYYADYLRAIALILSYTSHVELEGAKYGSFLIAMANERYEIAYLLLTSHCCQFMEKKNIQYTMQHTLL